MQGKTPVSPSPPPPGLGLPRTRRLLCLGLHQDVTQLLLRTIFRTEPDRTGVSGRSSFPAPPVPGRPSGAPAPRPPLGAPGTSSWHPPCRPPGVLSDEANMAAPREAPRGPQGTWGAGVTQASRGTPRGPPPAARAPCPHPARARRRGRAARDSPDSPTRRTRDLHPPAPRPALHGGRAPGAPAAAQVHPSGGARSPPSRAVFPDILQLPRACPAPPRAAPTPAARGPHAGAPRRPPGPGLSPAHLGARSEHQSGDRV